MNGLEKLLDECDNNIDFYIKHLERLRRNITYLDETQSLLNAINFKLDATVFREIEQFSNYNGYITISILDLSVNLRKW